MNTQKHPVIIRLRAEKPENKTRFFNEFMRKFEATDRPAFFFLFESLPHIISHFCG
jgi:hypothetical protein